MLLRISLIVAIVAGIATFVVSHMQVATKLTDLQTNLSNTQGELATSQKNEADAKAEAKTARDQAEKLDKELTSTKEQLETQTARANTQERRANEREGERDKARTELTEANRNLAAWRALSIPVEQVRDRLAALDRANKTIDAISSENKQLFTDLKRTKEELDKYIGDKEVPPDMSLTRAGRILAVDSQWDFVVLDLGSKEGAVPRGELLVNRDGKLVAKVRIAKVEETQSIANIMSGWKQADVLVGDQVLR